MTIGELFHDRYLLEKQLGRGSFAEVWLAKDTRAGNVELALKIYASSTGLPQDGIDLLIHEFSIMANVSHQNLLTPKFFDVCDQRPYLVMQYCQKGNLVRSVGHFTEQQAWQLLHDAASGLACLHTATPPIMHQDIKPANILQADNGHYMLTDFGISTKSRSTITQADAKRTTDLFTSAGTMAYMAPERFSKQNKAAPANDIYSLGVTVFELLTDYLPFGERGGFMQRQGAEVPELPHDDGFSAELTKVVAACMQENPSQRPTAAQLEQLAAQKANAIPHTDAIGSTGSISPKIPISPQPPSTSIKWRWVLAALALVCALAAIGFFMLKPAGNDTPEPNVFLVPGAVETTADSTAVPGVLIDTPQLIATKKAGKKSANDNSATTTSNTLQRTQQQHNGVATTTDAPAISSQGVLNLGYARYTGEIRNGKAHGYGTMVFAADHKIGDYDIQAGDRIEGDFYNGRLDNGTWYKQDGTTEILFIGH